MTDTLQFFLVTQPLYEDVQTDEVDATGSQPLVQPISGTVTFTPCDPSGNPLTQVISADLDATILLPPIQGRFSVNLADGTPDGALRAMNGSTGVELTDNQFLGLPTNGLIYQVSYTNVVSDGQQEVFMPSFFFAAPGNGAGVDLNTVSHVELI
jgi:hypothetical protein